MLPVAPLMIEHRLIDRMIRLMAQEAARIGDNLEVGPQFAFVEVRFIDAAVDFLRVYADRLHHGKEEDILFVALKGKPLSPEQLAILQQLQAEHTWGRQATANLAATRQRLAQGDPGATADLLKCLSALAEFYPRHMTKEDQDFFLPVMTYFSPEEKNALLGQMNDPDNASVHEKYQKVVATWEARGCKCHL